MEKNVFVILVVCIAILLLIGLGANIKISDGNEPDIEYVEKSWYDNFFDYAKEKLSGIGDYEFEYRNDDQFRMYAYNADFLKWQELVDELRAAYADVEFEYSDMFKARTDTATYSIYTDYYMEEHRVCVWVEKIEGGEME